MPHLRRYVVTAAAVCALAAPATADAGIWTPVATPTTQTITAIDYHSGDNFWFTTSSAIFKRAGTGWTKQLDRPGTNFNDIEFNAAGTIGLAVGDSGELWRFAGGAWTKQTNLLTYNTPNANCPSNAGSYTQTLPITEDLIRVRWIDDTTVFVLSERYGSLMRSANSGATWSDIDRQPDGSCRLGVDIGDVAVLPSNPDYMMFIVNGGCPNVYLSTNGLRSTAAYRGYACDGTRLWMDPLNPQRVFAGGPGGGTFSYSENGGQNWRGSSLKNGSYTSVYDYDRSGETSLGAGNAGYIFNSITPAESYLEPADGTLATNDWRAVDLASPSVGAVGGANGGLVVSNQLNTIPDIVAPTGTVTGPDQATAGDTVTFTANAADNAGGSGIDPAAYSWKRDGQAAGTGPSIALAFPTPGYFRIEVSFADRAGHTVSASKSISVVGVPRVYDDEDPRATITGPAFAVAGQAATFTVAATDTGGSGIDATGYRWTRNGSTAGSGSSISLTFAKPGEDTIAVDVRDRAGNHGTASVLVPIAPKPADRPAPAPLAAPAPKVQRAGGRYVIPVKGGYKLPPKVTAKLGCAGEVVMTIKKGARLLTARTTKLGTSCRYSKKVTLAKNKVGGTPSLRFTVRFTGNPWLAPVKRTYDVKVPH